MVLLLVLEGPICDQTSHLPRPTHAQEAVVKGCFPVNTRLTLEMGDKASSRPMGSAGNAVLEAKPVSMSAPKEAGERTSH